MNKIIVIISVVLFLSHPGTAQDDGAGLDRTQVDTVESRINVPDVGRNYEKANVRRPEVTEEPLNYDYRRIETEIPQLDVRLRVPMIKPEEEKPLYGNYLKAGFGNYVTPYFEGYANSTRSDEYLYGVHLKHLSSKNGPVDYSGTSNNLIEGYGKYFMDNASINGRIKYQRFRHNYYGFNQNAITEVDEDTIKQVYNLFSAKAGIENTNRDSYFDYGLNMGFYLVNDRREASEWEYLTDFDASYYLDDNSKVDLEGIYSHSKRTDSNAVNRNFLQVSPAYIYFNDFLWLRAGANIAWADDPGAEKSLHLYPNIHVDVNLLSEELTLFGGLKGELQRNLLRSFINENPFLAANVPLMHTNNTFDIYGGAKGNFLEKINYKVKVSYQTYKNLYFYTNSPADTSEFTVVYDDNTVTVLNLSANASYDITEKFRIGIAGDYYGYTMGSLENPWHRPNLVTSLLVNYNIYKKIFLNLDFYHLNGITAQEPEGEARELPAIWDLNAGAEYRFSSAFSAFVEVNNIFGNNYQRYQYYPVQGINFIAGLTYSF